MLDYLKLYPQTIEMVKRYKEDQRCRLYEAMAAYAFTGQEPAWPEDAPEWLIWEALRQHVDRADQKVNQLRQNGKKNEEGQSRADSAGQKSAETSKPEEAEEGQSKPEQTGAKESKPEQSEAKESKSPIHNTKDISHNPEEIRTDEEPPQAPVPEAPQTAKPAARSAAGRGDGSGFDDFWRAYPKKQDKQNALKAWKRLNPDSDTRRKILGAVQAQRASPQWQKDAGQFIPLPSTWLNGRRWEDQPVTGVSSQGRTVSAQMYTQRDYTEEELNACGVDLIAEAMAARQRRAATG